jgi:hypothetical protein
MPASADGTIISSTTTRGVCALAPVNIAIIAEAMMVRCFMISPCCPTLLMNVLERRGQ